MRSLTMRTRVAVFVVGIFTLVTANSLPAQQSTTPVVGWLNPQPLNSSQWHLDGFHNGLREGGYVDGKNVKLELRPADGKRKRLPGLAADLVSLGVSVIMAGSPPAALAAQRATKSIPIVFTSGADPVKIGLVSSYTRPGGNITGFHIQYSQVVGKRLALLHELIPKVKRIALLINPDNPSDVDPTVKNATEAATALGLDLKVFPARTPTEIDAAFAAMVSWRAGGVLTMPDPFLASRRVQTTSLAKLNALPTSVISRYTVEAGGLISYGPDIADMYRRAGIYVSRILKGENPASLPVQQPTKFETVLNLKTAKALGITVPPSIILSADDVIE
jgi:putative tryptophan/tyrosine transport system substrate-binding protein